MLPSISGAKKPRIIRGLQRGLPVTPSSQETFLGEGGRRYVSVSLGIVHSKVVGDSTLHRHYLRLPDTTRLFSCTRARNFYFTEWHSRFRNDQLY